MRIVHPFQPGSHKSDAQFNHHKIVVRTKPGKPRATLQRLKGFRKVSERLQKGFIDQI